MKKISVFFLAIIMLFTSSCQVTEKEGELLSKAVGTVFEVGYSIARVFGYRTDQERANETFELLIQAINEKNGEALCSLFSSSLRKDEEAFLQQLDSLLSFVDGEYVSYSDYGSPMVEDTWEDGKHSQMMECTYQLTTTESAYRVAYEWIPTDDFLPDQVGIISFYIIEEKDWQSDYIYAGDGTWRPGIHCDQPSVPYTNDYVDGYWE